MDEDGEAYDAGRRRDLISKLLRAQSVEGEEPTAAILLERMCLAATDQLGVAGASVALMTDEGSLGVMAGSDERSTGVDEAQFTLGEGPSFEAIALRRPVLTPDLSASEAEPWPVYRGAALEAGVRAVFVFPLHVGAAAFGALSIHLDQPAPFVGERLSMALTFAVVATQILLDGSTEAEAESMLDYRSEIYQAQGMTTVGTDFSLSDALSQMRAHAFAEGLTLADVAQLIVAGELSLGVTDR